MRINQNYHIDDPAKPVHEAVVSFEGISSAIGAATGDSLVDVALATQPSYLGQVCKILSGPAAGQILTIAIHAPGTGTLIFSRPCSNAAGAIVQVAAGTQYCIISQLGIDISGIVMSSLVPMFLETWQDEGGISIADWVVTNPATGGAWVRGAVGGSLRAISTPNLNETARLRSTVQWLDTPLNYGINSILTQLNLEFELRLGNVANLDNGICVFGWTGAAAADRTNNNIIAFALIGDALQTVTDNGGVETVNTGFGEVLTNFNKLRIQCFANVVQFWLNGAIIATHVTNLPTTPMYLNFYVDTEAGGAASIEVGVNRIWGG